MSNIQPYNPVDATPMPASPQSAGTLALQNLEAQAQAMGNAMKIAEAMCSTQMVPKAYQGKPADGAAAILYGAELGLNAIQSLQQVMVINGKPGVEARTMVALLRSHGYRFEVEENTDQAVTVTGIAPTGETYTSRWTFEMAQQAGYTKNALYKQIPASMLYAKAATEVCRRLGSHILSGIQYSTEELQLQPVQMQATRKDQPRERGADAVRKALASKQEQEPAARDWVTEVQSVTSGPQLNELMNEAQSHYQDGPEWNDLCAIANTKLEELAAGGQ